MANEKIVQIPLANVARVELVTEENTPKTYVVDTADEMKLEAFVSEVHRSENGRGGESHALHGQHLH